MILAGAMSGIWFLEGKKPCKKERQHSREIDQKENTSNESRTQDFLKICLFTGWENSIYWHK